MIGMMSEDLSVMWWRKVKNIIVLMKVVSMVLVMCSGRDGCGMRIMMVSRLRLVYFVVLVVVGLMKWFWVSSCIMRFVIVIEVLVSISVIVCGICVIWNIWVLLFVLVML